MVSIYLPFRKRISWLRKSHNFKVPVLDGKGHGILVMSFYYYLGLFAVFLMARPGSGFLVNNIQRSEIAFSEHSFTLFKR